MKEFNKYRKKPVVIEAIEYDENDNELLNKLLESGIIKYDKVFCDDDIVRIKPVIKTREGHMNLEHGNFIIKGVEGEYYPIDRDIFFKTYEEVKG